MHGSWRTLAVVAAAVAMALVLSASALALGGRSRSAASPQWKIRLGTATWSGRVTALYPGAANDVELFPFIVTNDGSSGQRLRAVTAAMATGPGGDVETAKGAVVRGCRTAWFSLSVHSRDRSLPAEVAPGATYAGQLDLSMGGSATNQDACRGSAPAFTVTAQ